MKKVQGNDSFQRINYLYQISKYVVGKNPALSSYYTNLAINVAKKNVLKIHPEVKRQICKKCRCILVNNVSAKMKIKNKNKTKTIEWTCKTCCAKKSFPAKKDKDHRVWLEKEEAVVEVITLDIAQVSFGSVPPIPTTSRIMMSPVPTTSRIENNQWDIDSLVSHHDNNVPWAVIEQGSRAVRPRKKGPKEMQTHVDECRRIMSTLWDYHSSLLTRPASSVQAVTPELTRSVMLPHQKHALAGMMWREAQKPNAGILATHQTAWVIVAEEEGQTAGAGGGEEAGQHRRATYAGASKIVAPMPARASESAPAAPAPQPSATCHDSR